MGVKGERKLKRADKEAYRQVVAELRDKHKGEIEPTIKVLISLRDDLAVSPKERINASKELRNWLGVTRPGVEKSVEPPAPAKQKEERPPAPELPPSIKADMDALVGAIKRYESPWPKR